jgi:hydrogenase maturation protein HypF
VTALGPAVVRKRIEIQGLVQGVGFRPFVYRLAKRFVIRGWVLNSSGGVIVEAEGIETDVDGFLQSLRRETPSLAGIDQLTLANQIDCGPRYTIIRDVPYDRPNTP